LRDDRDGDAHHLPLAEKTTASRYASGAALSPQRPAKPDIGLRHVRKRTDKPVPEDNDRRQWANMNISMLRFADGGRWNKHWPIFALNMISIHEMNWPE
jgi:hypothetical protein